MSLVDDMLSKVKTAYDLAQEAKNIELREVIAALRKDVVDLKEEQVRLRDERLQLEGQLQECRRAQDIESQLEFKEDVLYAKNDIGGYGKGPFCPTCWQGDGKLVSLTMAPPTTPVRRTCAHFQGTKGGLLICRRCAGRPRHR